jgi:hypothetical protein
MEQFRELEDFPGYKIGNMGTIIGKGNSPMKLRINTSGYYTLDLYTGKKKSVELHRLVARTWISNPENKPQIDHINRDRKDNRLENLRWVTRMENANNMSISKMNKSGIAGLHYNKRDERWVIKKAIMGVKYGKTFKERSEAEAYLKELVETPRFIDVDVSTK